MLFSVFKLFINNYFSFGKIAEDFKKGTKGIVKNVLIILLILYCIVVFGGMSIFSMISIYGAQKLNGTPENALSSCILMASMYVIFFGFLTAASNYATGSGEEQLISMPLKPIEIFGAKYAVAFTVDALISVVLILVFSFIYGFGENLYANPLYWIESLIFAVVLSLTVLLIIYALLIAVLLAFPRLRKRKVLSGISAFFIIVFAVSNSFIISSTNLSTGIVSGGNSGGSSFWKGVAKLYSGNIPAILGLLVLCALIIFVFLPRLAPLYIKTLNGFSEVHTKKLSAEKAERVLEKDIKNQSVFKTFLKRDIFTVLREPSFFLNGPFCIILLPVIFIFSFGIEFFSSGSSMNSVITEVNTFFMRMDVETLGKVKFYCVIIITGFTVLLGNFTNIASTSFSREGKGFYNLKAMPVSSSLLVRVKYTHSLIYIGVAYIVSMIVFVAAELLFQIPFVTKDFFEIILISLYSSYAISSLIILIDMWMDLVNPKLEWDNPVAAFKQNLNTLFGILFELLIIGIIALVVVFFIKTSSYNFLIMSIFIYLIYSLFSKLFYKYAGKKIMEL